MASAPAGLLLDHACIDVWQGQIDIPATAVEACHELLSVAEKQRAAAFTFADKYREYVVSRGLLRKALARVLQRPAGEFVIHQGDGGKPFLDAVCAGQAVCFNVSHSHGLAMVALSLDRQLGIDVEKIRADVNLEKLAARFFSAGEARALREYHGDVQAAFFATWTRKEAYVKALGKGIAFGLGEFDVNVCPHEAPRLLANRRDPAAAANWHMENIETEAGFIATVAADGGEFTLRCWQGE